MKTAKKKCLKCGNPNPKWIVKGMCPRCYANNYYWTKPSGREKNKKRALNWARSHKDYLLKYYKDVKHKVLSHYSPEGLKCACCGEDTYEFLTLDHINGGGNKHRNEIGRGRWFFTWIITHNFPPLFQVLCMNCNFAKGLYGKCPHQK